MAGQCDADGVAAPVEPGTATELWSQLESWWRRRSELLGDDIIEQWETAAG